MRVKLGLWLALTFLTIQVASSSWWEWKCCERKNESIKLEHELPLESSFQKMRWFQCGMLRYQQKVPCHITRLILSYLTFVPVTSQLCPHGNGVNAAAISHDSRWLLLSTVYPSSLYLSDLATGERVRTFTVPPSCSLWSCAIADNHSFVALGSENIYVWNTKSEKLVATLTGHTDTVYTCKIFFNDTRLASGSDDRTVRVWQVENFQWKRLYVLKEHTDRIQSILTFTRAGNPWMISLALDKTLRVWSSDTGKCFQILTGHTEYAYEHSCVMSLNQQVVGSIDGRGMETKLWDITTGTCITIPNISGSDDCYHHIAYLSSKRLVWWKSNEESSKVGAWNLKENKNVYTLPFEVKIKFVNVSSDGKYLIIVFNKAFTGYAFVQVHDIENGMIIESKEQKKHLMLDSILF